MASANVPKRKEEKIEEDDESSELIWENVKITEKEHEEALMILKQDNFYDDIIGFLSLASKNMFASKCDDLVFNLVSIVNYKLISNFLQSKLKQNISSLLNNLENSKSKDKELILTSRIVNSPIEAFLEVIQNHIFDDNKLYIYISKLYEPNKEEKTQIFDMFSEFKEENLEYFPVRTEEVFLLSYNLGFNTFCSNKRFYRIFILNRKLIVDYISRIRDELTKDRNN